ncbi:type II secretion system F family protein [Lentisphaerota bacterium WC36G]|nr:type II secretion system F family protein [Lentisphaerae bacterium WC36]
MEYNFRYKVLNELGDSEVVVITKENEQQALVELRQRNLIMLEKVSSTDNEKNDFLSNIQNTIGIKKKFNYYQFIDKLVPLLEANVTLERALQIIIEGSEKNDIFSTTIEGFLLQLHEGEKFSKIVSESKLFPPLYGHLLAAGEETGCLTEVALELQKFSEDSKELKDFLVTSAIYPALILSVISCVVAVLFLFVMPKFAEIFTQMGKKPPLLTQMMIGLSDIFIMFWWVIPVIITGLIVFLNYAKKGGKAKFHLDRIVLKVPILKKLLIQIEMHRFISTLAILCSNHVHLLSAINIGYKVVSNSLISKSFDNLSSDLRGGVSFSEALRKSEYAPNDLLQLLKVSEETGNIGKMLEHNSFQLERNIKNTLKRLLALFEPVMIVVLSVIVLTVVVAVLLAVLELNSL